MQLDGHLGSGVGKALRQIFDKATQSLCTSQAQCTELNAAFQGILASPLQQISSTFGAAQKPQHLPDEAILAGTPSDPQTVEQLQDQQGPNQDSKATSDNELAMVAGTIDKVEHTQGCGEQLGCEWHGAPRLTY